MTTNTPHHTAPQLHINDLVTSAAPRPPSRHPWFAHTRRTNSTGLLIVPSVPLASHSSLCRRESGQTNRGRPSHARCCRRGRNGVLVNLQLPCQGRKLGEILRQFHHISFAILATFRFKYRQSHLSHHSGDTSSTRHGAGIISRSSSDLVAGRHLHVRPVVARMLRPSWTRARCLRRACSWHLHCVRGHRNAFPCIEGGLAMQPLSRLRPYSRQSRPRDPQSLPKDHCRRLGAIVLGDQLTRGSLGNGVRR
jgi:hypothetical protein